MENQMTCRSELPMMDINKHDPEKSDWNEANDPEWPKIWY